MNLPLQIDQMPQTSSQDMVSGHWRGLGEEPGNPLAMLITHLDRPAAVMLDVSSYQTLLAAATQWLHSGSSVSQTVLEARITMLRPRTGDTQLRSEHVKLSTDVLDSLCSMALAYPVAPQQPEAPEGDSLEALQRRFDERLARMREDNGLEAVVSKPARHGLKVTLGPSR